MLVRLLCQHLEGFYLRRLKNVNSTCFSFFSSPPSHAPRPLHFLLFFSFIVFFCSLFGLPCLLIARRPRLAAPTQARTIHSPYPCGVAGLVKMSCGEGRCAQGGLLRQPLGLAVIRTMAVPNQEKRETHAYTWTLSPVLC